MDGQEGGTSPLYHSLRPINLIMESDSHLQSHSLPAALGLPAFPRGRQPRLSLQSSVLPGQGPQSKPHPGHWVGVGFKNSSQPTLRGPCVSAPPPQPPLGLPSLWAWQIPHQALS